MNSSICIEHHPLSGNRKHRHTPWLAAKVTGIPQSYVWFWINRGLLTTRKYVGKLYVCLEAVLELTEWELVEAASMTGDPIPEQFGPRIRETWGGPLPTWLFETPEEEGR